MRAGAADEEIEAVMRDTFAWSYIIRDPLGTVCACGRGSRGECVREGFQSADDHGAEELPALCETPEDEARALNGAWHLVLWPPRFDTDPRAFIGGAFDD